MDKNEIVDLAKQSGARIENWMTNPLKTGLLYMTPEQLEQFVSMVRSKDLASAEIPVPDGYKFEARGISKIDVSPHGGNWKPLYNAEKLQHFSLKMFLDLLATIHGDGGQHTEKCGVAKSTLDAIRKTAYWRAKEE